MIDVRESKFVVSCDGIGCDTEFSVYADDFWDAVGMIKEKGWRTAKDPRGDWVHYCPVCRRDPFVQKSSVKAKA